MDILRVTFVDGFCGGGAYSSRGSEVFGSPLLLLGVVDEARRVLNEGRSKPLTIDAEFHFIDTDRLAIDTLRAKLASEGYLARLGRDIHLNRSSFAAAYPQIKSGILARTRGGVGRSIFALDQKGYSDAPLPIVRDILASFTGAEVILTFAVGWLIDYLSDKPQTLRAVAPVGLSDQQIREFLLLKEQKGGRIIIERLLLQHLQHETGAQFASPFFIRSQEANKDLWIVHLSTHVTARNVMVEGHWSLKNNSLHFGKGGLELLGFDPKRDLTEMPDFWFGEREQELMLDHLAEDLLRRLRDTHGHESVEYIGFIKAVANETPARMTDFDRVTSDLIAARQLRVSTTEGQERRVSKPRKNDQIGLSLQPTFHFMSGRAAPATFLPKKR